MKILFKKTGIALIIFFALVGVFFTAVFIGMQFGVFNVRGSISERNKFFTNDLPASAILSTASSSATSTRPYIAPDISCTNKNEKKCDWNKTPEWEVIRSGLQKDEAIIARVSQETGVSKRMIAAVVVPEQIRFFTSNREVFKRYFEPMKILGSLSQFSLGVSGIKEETARDIEKYANDPASPFYPGENMAELVAYPSGKSDPKELFYRLTDEKDHYYSYLYTALYIKEIQEQWKRAGYDVTKDPEVVVTLFNIGFKKSSPNPNPVSGGATIESGGNAYTYGQLGSLFYHSNEISETFPQ